MGRRNGLLDVFGLCLSSHWVGHHHGPTIGIFAVLKCQIGPLFCLFLVGSSDQSAHVDFGVDGLLRNRPVGLRWYVLEHPSRRLLEHRGSGGVRHVHFAIGCCGPSRGQGPFRPAQCRLFVGRDDSLGPLEACKILLTLGNKSWTFLSNILGNWSI